MEEMSSIEKFRGCNWGKLSWLDGKVGGARNSGAKDADVELRVTINLGVKPPVWKTTDVVLKKGLPPILILLKIISEKLLNLKLFTLLDMIFIRDLGGWTFGPLLCQLWQCEPLVMRDGS